MSSLFNGRKIVIATKHHKEKVIGPILENTFKVNCIIAQNFDTDNFGTFTGEIERLDNPYTVAKNKCLLAMDLNNCDMAIASEGSFGPHPTLGFVYIDEEILVFVDKKNNLEISTRELSLETNFNGQEVTSEDQLTKFATSIKFPSHGLILRKSIIDHTGILKGITDWELLSKHFKVLKHKYGAAYVETDMRAMYNPTRMKVIQLAAIKLAEKINTPCPFCHMPGYGISAAIPGLTCGQCGFPTKSTIAYEYKCNSCHASEVIKSPHDKQEDPMFCDFCNP